MAISETNIVHVADRLTQYLLICRLYTNYWRAFYVV